MLFITLIVLQVLTIVFFIIIWWNTEGYESSGILTYRKCLVSTDGSGTIDSDITQTSTVSTADPLFNDPSSDDFTLSMSSPAIDQADANYAPSDDINGTARPQGSADDLGCYELSINSWLAQLHQIGIILPNNRKCSWNSDNVLISSAGFAPVLNANDQVGAIQIASGGVLTLNNSSYKLTVSSVGITSGGSLVISAGELECTGKFDHDGGLTMSGGTLDVNGEYESSATASETISGGTITVAGEWDGENDNAFTPTGGTVTWMAHRM